MRPESDLKAFYLFRILVLGAIARIVMATGCVEGDLNEEPDLVAFDDVAVVPDSQEAAPEEPPVLDLSPRWLPESLVPFRLPLEALGERHRPSPWPSRPEAISAVLESSNWDAVRPSVLALYKALGYRPVFLGSVEGRREALRLFAWLVASTELGIDPMHSGALRLLELTDGACKVRPAHKLGDVAHDELLQRMVQASTPSSLLLGCEAEWVPPDRELEVDVRLVAGYFVTWQSLLPRGEQIPIRWEGPQRVLPSLLELLPSDQLFWWKVAALRRFTHPALAWSTDTQGKWGRLKPGQNGPRVEELHRRLYEQGYLPQLPTGRSLRLYSTNTSAAVRAFRTAHGLPAKDQVDDAMVALLSLSREQHAGFVWLSLHETLRVGRHADGDYLEANLADGRLWWVQEGHPEALYRLATGAPLREGGGLTPTGHSQVVSVTFHPVWYPTFSQWKRQILPKTKRDKNYLANRGFEKRGNRWVQLPGPANHLGLALLSLAEENGLALHGTPDGKVFEQATRTVTSGEIWVEGVEDLAQRLVARAAPSESTSRPEAEDASATRSVALAAPIPLYVVYDRVRVAPDGQVSLVQDPYRMASTPDKGALKGLRLMLRRVTP